MQRNMTRRAVANGTALLLIAAGAWGAVNTPVFHARDVRVTGSVRVTRDAILDRAGITPTTNVVRLMPDRLEERLEGNPWIARARVTRDLPSTIAIEITERRPVATIRSGGTWAVVAEDAVVVAIRRERPDLPVIDAGPASEGRRRALAPVRVTGTRAAFALPLVRVLSGLPQTIRVAAARPLDAHGTELRLATGARVRYGDPALGERKNSALVALLRWARSQGRSVRAVDVRVPEAPALTLFPG